MPENKTSPFVKVDGNDTHIERQRYHEQGEDNRVIYINQHPKFHKLRSAIPRYMHDDWFTATYLAKINSNGMDVHLLEVTWNSIPFTVYIVEAIRGLRVSFVDGHDSPIEYVVKDYGKPISYSGISNVLVDILMHHEYWTDEHRDAIPKAYLSKLYPYEQES